MQAEYLTVNECGEGQIVEQISKVFPHVRIPIFAQTLVVESVDLGDLTGFMVAAEDGDSFTIADLEGHQQRHCLHRVVAAIDVVTHEQVICVGRPSTYSEQLHKIVKLSVDIAAHCHRAFYFLNVRLLSENLLCLKRLKENRSYDFGLGKCKQN